MVAVVVLVIIVVVALLAGVHWYVWRRMVRDTTAPGGTARRVGTVVLWVLPLLSLGALMSGRAGAPFEVQQVLAWPGFLWLAVLLYLVLALVVGEAVRPVLRRALAYSGRAAAPGPGDVSASASGEGPTATGTAVSPAPGDAASAGARTDVLAFGDEAVVAPASRAAAPAVTAGPGDGGVATKALVSPDTGDAASAGTRTDVRGSGDVSVATEAVVSSAPGDARAGGAPAAAGASPAEEAVASGDGAVATKAVVSPDTGDAAPPPGDAPRGALSRRLFVARIVGGAAATAALGTVGYGAYGVLRGPRVKRVTVPLAKLPRAAHGYRIAVVSDIHLGPVLGRAHTQRIVDSINATQPDLVAVVGDLVDGSVADLGPAAEPLAGLRSRDGAFFVTGNHEYFSGADAWVDHVRELGLRPLRNERVEIAGGFDLAGVDDVAGESEGQGPDFVKALGDRDRSRAAVLLAHQPVVIHDAVGQGVDLQLSGHTHGGQLWPGNLLAGLANPTVAGLERYGDTQLYVSRGAGAWGPPVRVGAESDITVVELAARRA
ncbi:metallophosphoesterase [Streptomyces sp. NPDC015127]|uniref:metallophosphoesterase n=1 Tax=Streptomyces sp. NPDC015127 TaxID=3364939 RepID=UPI0036FD2CAB